MSAYVLDQDEINTLTRATAAMLQMNRKYSGSYPLGADTVQLLGRYADDLHSIYRALYIANIKAVNGRYREDTKTLPKYKPLHAWDTDRLNPEALKEAARVFSSYMYQCSEDPIHGSAVYNAFYDVYKLLCLVIVKNDLYR